MLPLFVGLYIFYTFFLPHYTLIAAPAVLIMILSGAAVACSVFPSFAGSLRLFFTLIIIALSMGELPEFNRQAVDEWFHAQELEHIDQVLANLPEKPAIVMFKFSPQVSSEEEPVYNADVVYPDLAPVIRAHDLGDDRNVWLYRYYARREPDRAVYRYDRKTSTLEFLGHVRALAVSR